MSWLILLPGSVAAEYFWYAARTEERNLAEVFGEAYREYRGRSKMLVPWVY